MADDFFPDPPDVDAPPERDFPASRSLPPLVLLLAVLPLLRGAVLLLLVLRGVLAPRLGVVLLSLLPAVLPPFLDEEDEDLIRALVRPGGAGVGGRAGPAARACGVVGGQMALLADGRAVGR